MLIETGKSTSSMSLTTILVNDFGDSYHRLDNEPSSELERDVRRIRRRYRAFDEYKKAMAIYVEYMDKLASKYGGHERFKTRLEANTIFEYIPPLPKLKKNPINEFIMEHKIMISDPNRMVYNEEKMQEYEEEFNEELVSDTFVSSDIIKAKNKSLTKIAQEARYGKIDVKRMQEVDALETLASYFDSTNTKKGKKEKKNQIPSVTDIIEDKIKEEEDSDVVFFKGRYLTASEVKEMKLYQELNNYGWNSLALMKQHKGGSSSAIVNALKDEKYKKKRDKMNKKKNKGKSNKSADEFLIKMMGDNDDYESFGDYQEDMLQYTINNVFK